MIPSSWVSSNAARTASDARVIQSRRDGIRFHHLAPLVLHHQRPGPVQDSRPSFLQGGCRHPGTFSPGFRQHDAHPLVIQVMVDRAGRVAASPDAGDQVIGIFPPLPGQQLSPDFLADY